MTHDLLRNLLVLLLVLPAVAAVIVALLGPRRAEAVRWVSFVASVATLGLAVLLAGHLWRLEHDAGPPPPSGNLGLKLPTFRPQFVPGATESNPHATTWNMLPIGTGKVQFFIGLDGLNVWLVVLTAVLMLPSVLVSWRAIQDRVNEFFAWLLLLQTAMMGIFLAFDIILFYVFFEMSLVPLFFLIGIWGGPARQHAAVKFFLYTLTGSLITLLGVLGIVLACAAENGNQLTFSLPRLVEIVHGKLAFLHDPNNKASAGLLTERAYWGSIQFWVFLALVAGFAIKVPLVPFHTWLPLAHVEAPTAGSVDLAGVLLKVGVYGFLRLCLPLVPDASLSLGLSLVSILAAIGIVYGAYCAYAQDDIKRLVAYSSVSHLGLCMLGLFALNTAGISGSIVQMVNHGLSTGALFLIVGMLYERYHTRKLTDYGGMAKRLPLLAAFMVFACLTSVGLPGLNGFIGEVLVLMGVFQAEWTRGYWPVFAVIGASGIILGAWYLFTMLRQVFFGALKEPHVPLHDDHGPIHDLDLRELVTLVPIAVLCVAIGVYPQPLLATSQRDVDAIVDIAQRARKRAAQPPPSAPPAVAAQHAGGATP